MGESRRKNKEKPIECIKNVSPHNSNKLTAIITVTMDFPLGGGISRTGVSHKMSLGSKHGLDLSLKLIGIKS